MKLLGAVETRNATLTTTRKLLKPQVEKRRRERMNRSLESLRALLLQMPQHQELVSGRMEKAAVLEHTVLFLQSAGQRGTGEGVQRQSFLDGFSACLQRAAHFLQEEGEGQHVEGELSATLSRHLTHPVRGSRVPISPQSALTQPKERPAQLWRHKQHSSPQLCAALPNNPSHQHRAPLAHGHPNLPQRSHREALTNNASVWRPWP
ncbi:hypothetical protein JZ751_024407 [Albula glossodonta]|uniref:Hairy and enhancer of split related-7 n=1 Tax=Albula glossodonta TaxID=121402 RepID=A0A8T2NN64_9TELE|nr:hypothetical protein JZ751_024407 [Albula glossodonta]